MEYRPIEGQLPLGCRPVIKDLLPVSTDIFLDVLHGTSPTVDCRNEYLVFLPVSQDYSANY